MQYNIPRVPVEQTDDLTEYEFDYEILLREAFQRFMSGEDDEENKPLEITQEGDRGVLGRGFATDPELYEEIVERAKRGEYIDFNLPDDTNAPTLRQKLSNAPKGNATQQIPDDFEPVNPAEIFGGGVRA